MGPLKTGLLLMGDCVEYALLLNCQAGNPIGQARPKEGKLTSPFSTGFSMGYETSSVLRRSYDRSASGYDSEFRALQRVKYRTMLGERGEWLEWSGVCGRVLDLGCGT